MVLVVTVVSRWCSAVTDPSWSPLAPARQEELDAFIKSADTSGKGEIRYEELCARFGDLNVVDDKG